MFWRSLSPPFSGQRMKAIDSSETLIITYKNILCQNPGWKVGPSEDHNPNFHHCENLKFNLFYHLPPWL
jgi:hypothetical protein